MTTLLARTAHSLLLRLAILLLALGGLIAAVLVISWFVFQSIEANMATLTSQRMPELRGSARVVAASDATRNLLKSSLIAENPDDLRVLVETASSVFSQFRDALDQLPEVARTELYPTLTQTEKAVAQLLQARSREFRETTVMMQALEAAAQDAQSAGGLIEEANDSAVFEMTLNGEDAIQTIDGTLTRLVEENFQQFQTALSIRGEINLIAGLAIAYAENDRSQIRSIIADLSKSAMDRLSLSMDQSADTEVFASAMPVLRESMVIFERVFQAGRTAPSSSDVLAARLAVDTILSPVLDDIYFELILANDEAKQVNRASLDRLLDIGVEGMRANANLDAAMRHYFSLLLQVAQAPSEAVLDIKLNALGVVADDIVRLKMGTDFEGQVNILNLLQLADPETGIATKRLAMFEAHAAARKATTEATEAVDAIAVATNRFSARALTQIEEAAGYLAATIESARVQLLSVATVSGAALLVAPIFLWLYVTRPIGRVTQTTERLANGDLSEIKGLSRNEGELGRMVSALHVFRESALKTIALQEEERKREREALEAEKELERRKREDQQRTATETAKREAAEREKEARLAAEAEERQLREIAERTARMEDQSFVVLTLADGLNRLASGDLTVVVNDRFPDAYEALRLDFNAALENLSQIVYRLKDSSETIEGSCGEIASASGDLARRTETSASTLAETVLSIGDLSSSVAQSAENADEASTTIKDVRQQAHLSNDVMKKAKAAMGRIEDASQKITSIVGIIDSIAFQTNLLALNAGVEAARAGNAGQGFAVVANEVRTLAQRCSEAASEIGVVVEESTNSVQEGVELTGRANESMSVIQSGIDQISMIVDGLADESARQAQKLGGVNQAIQELDRSTQQNAAMFEETSASNQTLSSEAKALSSVVSSFRVEDRAVDGGEVRQRYAS